MRSLMHAIGRALAAMTLWVVVRCEETGRLILRALGAQGPDPQMLVDEYVEHAAEEPAPVVRAAADRQFEHIRAVADALLHRTEPADVHLVGLSDRTVTWLGAMPVDMLLKVAKAKDEDLQQHMRGRRSIRGLLAYDPESVQAYRQALERDAVDYTPAPEPARRTRRRAEPLLPALSFEV